MPVTTPSAALSDGDDGTVADHDREDASAFSSLKDEAGPTDALDRAAVAWAVARAETQRRRDLDTRSPARADSYARFAARAETQRRDTRFPARADPHARFAARAEAQMKDDWVIVCHQDIPALPRYEGMRPDYKKGSIDFTRLRLDDVELLTFNDRYSTTGLPHDMKAARYSLLDQYGRRQWKADRILTVCDLDMRVLQDFLYGWNSYHLTPEETRQARAREIEFIWGLTFLPEHPYIYHPYIDILRDPGRSDSGPPGRSGGPPTDSSFYSWNSGPPTDSGFY